ncbi:hypothetical protein ACVDG8_037165 (plasmid) [Mesorhizobium sp. ORM8.1]
MINLRLKEPTFDSVSVGETLGPRHVVADERFLHQGMFALDDYRSWYTQEFPSLGQRVVPSAMILRDLHLLIGFYYDPARMMGLHQREVVRFHRPVPVGTKMVYEGRFSDKYVRRGKGYVVYEAEARDAVSGQMLVSQICTEIMRVSENYDGGAEAGGAPARRVAGTLPTETPAADRAYKGMPELVPIKGLGKRAYQDQMSVFSGCDMQWVNIHTSVDRAVEGGYRDTLLAGLMQTCWLSEMAANFFGESWLYGGTIEHVYLKPVYHNEKIACEGMTVRSPDDERIKLEVWTKNENSDLTSVGWASCP